MPEIPEIGVRAVAIPEIPEWRAMPPQSIPEAPPITLQIGFPVANIPGCVETRTSAAGDKEIYNTDPEGNVTVCGGEMPSYKPIDYTPGTLTYGTAKPPSPPEEPEAKKEKKSAGDSNQPTAPLPSGSGIPDNLLDAKSCRVRHPTQYLLAQKIRVRLQSSLGTSGLMASAKRCTSSCLYQPLSATIFLVRLLSLRLRRLQRQQRRARLSQSLR